MEKGKRLLYLKPNETGHRMCMLIVTHACNLNCCYCYEAHKDPAMMSPSLARTIIKSEIDMVRNSERFDRLEVHFIGGEPFMNFPLIRDIVEWMENADLDVPVLASASTNGTLIREEDKAWLWRHRRRFYVVLSCDGTESMQEKNRGTNENEVDFGFFVHTWPGYTCHMTVSRKSLPHLAEGILHIQERGGTLDVALAQGEAWTIDDEQVYARELKKLADRYLEDERLPPVNLIAGALFGIGMEGAEQRKFCGTGTSMATYDVDGAQYPCHMFSPLVCGENKLPLGKSHICDGTPITDKACATCVLKHWCFTCYGFNWRYRGALGARDHGMCGMLEVQAREGAAFQLRFYSQHRDKITDVDMPQLKAALIAHDLLKSERR